MSSPVEVAIVARNAIVREGLDNILSAMEFVVVAKAADGNALVAELAERPPPHLILLDSIVAEESIEDCRLLHEAFKTTQLVLMAEDCRVNAISRAFSAGIDGYLAKGIACESLASALRLVSLGEQIIPSATVTALADGQLGIRTPLTASIPTESLSERELVILRSVARGDPNKLISDKLGITETTVKGHIKAILRKLGLMNRTQAAMWAIFNGLAPDHDSASRNG